MATPPDILEDQRFMARLQHEGRKLGWSLNATAYELEGRRWVIFTLQQHERKEGEGPFRVAELRPEWGPEPLAAMADFLDAFRGFCKG